MAVVKKDQYQLLNENVDIVSEEVVKFLESSGVDRREALRTKLTIEEILLEYQDQFGDNINFTIRYRKGLQNIKIELVFGGEAFDPLHKEREEDNIIHGLLVGMGLAPTWNYKNGKNYIVFILKKKPLSDTVKLMYAIFFSIIAGILLSELPSTITNTINDYLLTPVTDKFMDLISAVSVPLIFFSILCSICSMGNLETLGKIGSKTLITIMLYTLLASGFITVWGCMFYYVEWGSGSASGYSQILELIYDIIPSNLFEPFVTGNSLQLIFVSIMLGLAMLVLASRVSYVFRIVEQLNAIAQTMISGLASALPILIFALFTSMILSGQLLVIMESWKIVIVSILLMAMYYIANVLRIAIVQNISPILLLKKTWPTFFVSFITASSAAAFSTNVHDANKKLGIDKKFLEFGTPLGQVLFKPSFVALLFGLEAGLAEQCGIEITLPWIIIGMITNVLMSFAVPSVSGSGMMAFTIVFNQLGIPMEMMGLALAIDTITDFAQTAVNVSSWQLCQIDVADSLKMIDKKLLHRP